MAKGGVSGASLKNKLGNGIHGLSAVTKGKLPGRLNRANGGRTSQPIVESAAEDRAERELGPISGAKGKRRMDRKA